MTEYAMILAAIAVAVITGFRATGVHTDQTVDQVSRLMVAHAHGD